jgi:2-polyprenyl-6-hydroxyphenyl methylase/3-demethylubiquinone-9 3-methyltransferase
VANLKTRTILNRSELVAHFDRHAAEYEEAHGDACRLLDYRLALIRQRCHGRSGVLLEIGCGTAIHLAALAPSFSHLIGTDISPLMIDSARRKLQASLYQDRVELRVDPAEELGTVESSSVDVVLCVGALEHMLDRAQVVRQVARVLRDGGQFVLLTPNGGYCWYAFLAPVFGIATRHLSTDRFLKRREAITLLRSAGLQVGGLDYWTFIPKGDMPSWTSVVLEFLDGLGRLCRIAALRGGLILTGVKSG